jgi:DNA invertase Pin-like site-specific DNA recombinase
MHANLPLSQMKITPFHLERKAVIYIRQSSPKQVREHLDSQLTQRTLVERAMILKRWPQRSRWAMSALCSGGKCHA